MPAQVSAPTSNAIFGLGLAVLVGLAYLIVLSDKARGDDAA